MTMLKAARSESLPDVAALLAFWYCAAAFRMIASQGCEMRTNPIWRKPSLAKQKRSRWDPRRLRFG
jgi:hypothetical protein